MRSKLIAIVLILALATPACALNDKAGHALVGAGIATVGTPEQGFWLSVGVSGAKELWDSTGRGTPEWADFGAGVGGALLVYLIRKQTGWEWLRFGGPQQGPFLVPAN